MKDDEDHKDGKCRIRSRYRIHELLRGRHQIEFYETPYEVPHEKIIADLQNYARGYSGSGDKQKKMTKVEGITNIRNLSDRLNPTSICVDVKNGIDPDKVAQQLLALSSELTVTFPFNHVALVEGKPIVLSLKQIIQQFIDFRREIVEARTNNRIARLEGEKELQEGLQLCLLDIDEVIKVIRNSDGEKEALLKLMKKFKLNERQADFVASMRLRQLTKADKIEIDRKIDKIKDEIARLQDILKNLDKEIIKELQQVKKEIDRPRRSVILPLTLNQEKEATIETKKNSENLEHLAVENQPCSIILSENGLVWRTEIGKETTSNSKTGLLLSKYDTNTHDEVLIILSSGRSFRLQAMMLPTTAMKVDNLVTMKTGETVVGVVPLSKDEKTNKYTTILGFVTKSGICKTFDTSTLTKQEECPVMSLEQGDKILAAKVCSDTTRFIYIADNYNLLTFDTKTVRPQQRGGSGVVGIKLVKDSHVIYADIVDTTKKNLLLTATDKTIKVSDYADYPTKGRGSQGVRCHRFLKGENGLISAYCGEYPSMWSGKAEIVLPTEISKRDGSGTKYELEETAKITVGNSKL